MSVLYMGILPTKYFVIEFFDSIPKIYYQNYYLNSYTCIHHEFSPYVEYYSDR